jgi:hypothetical protein
MPDIAPVLGPPGRGAGSPFIFGHQGHGQAAKRDYMPTVKQSSRSALVTGFPSDIGPRMRCRCTARAW